MISRRTFLQKTAVSVAAMALPSGLSGHQNKYVMTVSGPISSQQMKFTLSHEHVLVDFIGADKVSKDRYNADEVFETALPYLKEARQRGCHTLVECTPAYIGRDVELLKRLALESGLNILTTTGYYGAAKEKYIPAHAYTETANQLSERWIREWTDGIEGTGIKPGLIKTGVDKAPLSAVLRKLIDAAALTHLATGLPIGVHTGDGAAAEEQLEILASRKVAPSARIWIHAQNEKDSSYHVKAARQGSWVSFDGVSKESIQESTAFFQKMKRERLLHRVLASHDAGWYHVGEAGGGKYNDYNTIFTDFIPALLEAGFTQKDIDQIFVINPAEAFTIEVRKLT
jgi:phosphotriesterase-related protein